MAASLPYLRPSPVVCSAASGRRGQPSSSSSQSWWTPLFGWSSDPDYISSAAGSAAEDVGPAAKQASWSRFAPGCFTEEKARQLRMKTLDTTTFHDIMYHSAIAARLASDVSEGNAH
ncbi:hypothetical protein RJ640_021211 [Escallonia rubra]|uniref:Uncharacterized protein n=1 Tax=Escallonia rubra TaxID=112253 RepID=A0AA88U828_9ASTE|nr:hypothetical protein RJ640_021211 [Escallonia rubra]